MQKLSAVDIQNEIITILEQTADTKNFEVTKSDNNNNLYVDIKKKDKKTFEHFAEIPKSGGTLKLKKDYIEEEGWDTQGRDGFLSRKNLTELDSIKDTIIKVALRFYYDKNLILKCGGNFIFDNKGTVVFKKYFETIIENNRAEVLKNVVKDGEVTVSNYLAKKKNTNIKKASKKRFEELEEGIYIYTDLKVDVMKNNIKEANESISGDLEIIRWKHKAEGTPLGKDSNDENKMSNDTDEGEKQVMSEKVLRTVNTILCGPPGTGKTYNSVIYAVNTIDKDIAAKFEGKDVSYDDYLQTYLPKYRELEKNNQIVFTTFHQSYGYEEFIEGIKPKTDEGNVIYNVEAGVFKEFCKRAKDSGNLEGIDNFEETWGDLREDIEEEEFIRKLNQTDKKFKNTKDGVELLNPEEDDKSSYFISREQCYEFYRTGTVSKNKARLHFIKAIVSILKDEYGLKDYIRPSDDSNKKFVFIIDEINRGNTSKIFGELITLIEDSKREGAKEAMSVKLPYSGEEFSVPNNVYILGTMNTADRSIALMDTALRRRFEFVEMMPDSSTLQGIEVEGIDIKKMLDTMNKRIEFLYDREHTLGHAFFMGLKEEQTIEKLASIFQNRIIPLLQEYFYEGYEKIMLVLGIKPEEATEEDFISKKEVEGISKSDVEKYAIEPTYQINNEAFKNIDKYRKLLK